MVHQHTSIIIKKRIIQKEKQRENVLLPGLDLWPSSVSLREVRAAISESKLILWLLS